MLEYAFPEGTIEDRARLFRSNVVRSLVMQSNEPRNSPTRAGIVGFLIDVLLLN